MKTRNVLVKIAIAAGVGLLLLSLAAPVLFPQSSGGARQEKLLNGLKVVMLSNPKAEKVELRIRIHSGSAFDPQGKEGLMRMLAANIFPSEAAREFFSEDLGGSLEIKSDYDFIQIDASATPENLLSLLETVSTGVTNPTIDKETTAKLKSAQLDEVRNFASDPARVADMAVARRLFGTFPYGRSKIGTVESLQKIDFADLIDAKQRFLAADNATLVLSGRFDQQLAYRAVRRYFGSWLKADKSVPATFRQPDAPPTGLEALQSPGGERTEVRFAVRGAARSGVDFVAAEIAALLLESRLRAALPAEYREHVKVEHHAYVLPGLFIVRFAGPGDPAKVAPLEILAKACAGNVTDHEFQSAKAAFAAKWNSVDPAERWLDIDTYRLESIERENIKIASIKLSDVQDLLLRMQKLPVAAVALARTSTATK